MKKDSLEKKIAAYVTLAAAYLAAHPVEADAQVMYTNVTPDDTIHNSFFNLDLNNDGVVDFKLIQTIPSGYSYCSTLEFEEKAGCLNQNQLMGHCSDSYGPWAFGYYPSNLPNGQQINAGQYFNNYPTLNRYHDRNCPGSGVYNVAYTMGCIWGANNLVGLRVKSGANYYYGWMRVDVYTGQIVLKDYAINLTPNAGIQAGVIPCPVPVNPHITNLTNHSVRTNWNTLSQAVGYRVQYRVVGATNWITKVVSANVGFRLLTNLAPNTNYEWRVRTVCQQTPLVWSNYTTVQTFTTPLRLEDESIEASLTVTGNELFIFPNPATNEIHLLIGDGGDYELKIFNMLGQQVAAEKIKLQEDESVTVSTSGFAAGTYQIIVTGNEGNFTGRFIKE